ncbi:hypothetical protein PG984_006528 [Apiospora sp. TS-2023a]
MPEPFPVEWLNKNVCPDHLVRNLANRLNFDEEAGLLMPFNPHPSHCPYHLLSAPAFEYADSDHSYGTDENGAEVST